MSELRGKTPEVVRKEVRAHVLAYTPVLAVMAQAAAGHDLTPRSVIFTGTMQTLEADPPLLAPGLVRDAAGRGDRARRCSTRTPAIRSPTALAGTSRG